MEFQVKKTDLNSTRIVDTNSKTLTDLADGEMLVNVDCFSFTANNITYGVTGDRLGYWQFFPAVENDDEEWGVIPVWGFADVIASKSAEVGEGERLFGYFPPASQLVMKPSQVRPELFIEGAAHRSHLPAGYNTYRRMQGEPGYHKSGDYHRALLFPLHMTSFSLWDTLKSNDWYGAEQLIIVSASSKTSSGLAYGLDADQSAPPIIGITSAKNLPLVEKMQVYKNSFTYDDLSAIDTSKATVIVDMSGSAAVLGELHAMLQDNMIRTLNVGMTHWNVRTDRSKMILDRCEMFFAPTQIQSRLKEWGPEEFGNRSMAFMQEVGQRSFAWLSIEEEAGLDALNELYDDVINGNYAPESGLIIKM